MLAYESQHFGGKLVLPHVKKPKSFVRHLFLQRPTLNARVTAGHETGYLSPYLPHSCRHELSEAAEAVASPVSAKGEEVQSRCWHRKHNILTVASKYRCRLTAYLPLDGQLDVKDISMLKTSIFEERASRVKGRPDGAKVGRQPKHLATRLGDKTRTYG